MRTWWAVVAACAMPCAAAWAQVSQEEFEKVKKELEEIRRKLGETQEPETGQETIRERAQEELKRRAGTIYGKPFLARLGPGVHLGGYIDLEYIAVEESNDDTFDQHRFVPFFYADVSESIKVAAEVEIEHGNELGIEFAHVDWWMHDAINFRAGIILDPLGKFNLVHDAPFQDLTQRPLVDEWIIPAVLREPGAGFFGTFDLDPWKIDYEVYVVNGFKGLSESGTTEIDTITGLRDARPHANAFGTSRYRDFNDNKAVVGRVAVSPFLGLELGGSVHHGAYDESGDNDLTIFAVDWTVSGGGLYNALGGGPGLARDIFFAIEVVGEWAMADLDRNAEARAAGVPGDLDGYYIEFRYHFMPEFLRNVIPGASDESTFTFIVRWDDTDLDGAKRSKLTAGLNFRLREPTVFKIEVGKLEESGDAPESDNDVFAASVATYF